MRFPAIALWLGLLAPSIAAQEDDFWALELRTAQESLLKGRFAEAENGFEEILLSVAEDPAGDRPDATTARRAQQGLLELRLLRGDYAGVQKQIEGLAAGERDDVGYRVLLARALQRRGDYEPAAQLWLGLVETNPDDVKARFSYGAILAETGQADAARQAWRAAVDRFGQPPADAVAMAYLGKCLIELGGKGNIERASQLLVSSVRAAPERPEARTALGALKFGVYGEANGFPSGEGDLKKVLETNGEVEAALLWLYRLRSSNFQLDPDQTERYLSRALALNPNSVPALSERGVVLLRDRQFDVAAKVFDAALAVNPRDKHVLAHRSAVAMLMHDKPLAADLRARAVAVDRGFAEFDRIQGDHLVALYRFADAVPYYRRALKVEPDDPLALNGLAKALVYTGRGPEAVEALQRAKELQKGFVNPWRNNALAVEDLLGEEYEILETDGFRFRIHRDDLEVLIEYLPRHHAEAREVLGAKYGYRPEEGVTVEVFHTWADFSVRTIGFRGFAALGACFGRFITLVSPSDDVLRRQDFMWAATVWHEYTHVLTLALSKHRVPRWLTEGFSVYEERQRNPAWERGMDRELFDAYHNGDIVPVLQLNRLFRGPRILFGYYQGGLIVEYLSEKYGFDKVVAMLEGYGRDQSTRDIFEEVFGVDPEDFDAEFLEFVRSRKLRRLKMVPRLTDRSIERLMTQLIRDPDDVESRVLLGWAYLQRGNTIDAGNQVRLALAVDPEDGRGLLLLADLLRRRKAMEEAIDTYRLGFAAGADDFDSRVRFGKLLESRGDSDGAMDQYQRAKACWPQCTDQTVAPNLLLARLLRELGRNTEAMMELKAFVERTGRAFAPRLELAAMEKANGSRAEEAKLLQEAVWIDPFMRELHVRLGDALEELGRVAEAARAYRVALAVRPEMDRAYMGREAGEIPDPASAPEREARGEICFVLARLYKSLGEDDKALQFLDRVLREAPGSEVAEGAQLLRDSWSK